MTKNNAFFISQHWAEKLVGAYWVPLDFSNNDNKDLRRMVLCIKGHFKQMFFNDKMYLCVCVFIQ